MTEWTWEKIEESGREELEAVTELLKQEMTFEVMEQILIHMNGVYVFSYHRKAPEEVKAVEEQLKHVIWENITQYRWMLTVMK